MPTKKIGRPTDSIKDTMVRVRVDKETLIKLDELVRMHSSNRSDVIRNAIETVYDLHKK